MAGVPALLLTANSEGLYFGALTYPCTKFFSTRFTTTCTGCDPFSVWIQIGSYRVTLFFVNLFLFPPLFRSYLLCLGSPFPPHRGRGPPPRECLHFSTLSSKKLRAP